MKGKQKWVVVLGVLLVTVCIAVPVAFLLLLPVPLSVRGQIEEDLSRRAAIVGIYGPLNQGVIEQIFSRNHKRYTYEIVEVVQKYPADEVGSVLISDEASKALCISIRVTYPTRIGTFIGGRTNPEIFHYLAQRQNGEWSIEFLDRRSSTCR